MSFHVSSYVVSFYVVVVVDIVMFFILLLQHKENIYVQVEE